MKARYHLMRCKSALSKSGLPGLDYALNPYRGCEHGCLYCYSPAILRDAELVERWGQDVWLKENVAEVLRAEVRRKRPGVVGVSTVCDPYQPIEKEVELTRRCLEVLRDSGFGVCIQTKSDLVLRDRDLIRGEKFEVGVTVTTLDADVVSKIEPRAPDPDARVQVLKEFKERNVETWLFLGPIIPGVNDSPEQIEEVLREAKSSGSYVMYDKLNVKTGVLERLERVFGAEEVAKIKKILQTPEWWRSVKKEIERKSKVLGLKCESAF